MKDVVGTLSIALMACMLTACETSDTEVSSLGKKLPAPVLKNSNMLEEDGVENQGYIHIQGVCDMRIGDVFLSFDKIAWHQPAEVPNTTGTSLSTATVNDRNCSDGTFDIYLTATDVASTWGLDPTTVQQIYLKGDSAIGYTELLAITKVAGSPDVAHSLDIEVMTRTVGETCKKIKFTLRDDTNTNAILTSAVSTSFTASYTYGGGTTTALPLYTDSSCAGASSSTGTVTIHSGSSVGYAYISINAAPGGSAVQVSTSAVSSPVLIPAAAATFTKSN